jgi:hypothetical protein
MRGRKIRLALVDENPTCISTKVKTREKLRSMLRGGDGFDEVLWKLINFYEENGPRQV